MIASLDASPVCSLAPTRAVPTFRPLLALCLLASTLLLSACSGFETDRPPLSDSTMVHLLTEMHLAAERHTVAASIPPGLRDSVFAQFSVTSAQYETTLRYYSRHPDAFETLYNTVVDSLNAARMSVRSDNAYPRPGSASPPTEEDLGQQ